MSSITPEAASDRLELAAVRADAIEDRLHAFAYRPDGYAAPPAGLPLSGVPVGVKDLIDTADMPTTYGSAIFAGHRPTRDAWIVARLRELGAVIFGKTVTTEFAWRTPGPTVNPWNAAHTPGGSSSGSAAAVGAGIVDIALGTQTVGSIIRPAAYCGAVGYKPTFGAIPTDGTHPLAPTLDHLGFIVSDCNWAATCEELLVEGRSDAALPPGVPRQGVQPATIGIYRSSRWDQADPAVQGNLDATIRLLRSAGVRCTELNSDTDIEVWLALVDTILAYEARESLRAHVEASPDKSGRETRDLVAKGAGVSAAQYREALAAVAKFRAQREGYLDGVDAVLSIASPTAAPAGLGHTGDASFCAPWTLLGLPAVSLPSGLSDDCLPLSIQLIGHGGEDATLIGTAQWLSAHLPRISAPATMPRTA